MEAGHVSENALLDNSKHRSRVITRSRLSEGRKIYASACKYQLPGSPEFMFAKCYGHQEFKSRRVLR